MKSKICGIYCIENLLNHKKYIGQSVDIYGRFYDHKRHLKLNRHDNNYLQNEWNKHGSDNFLFYVITQCTVEELDQLEIFYINKFNTLNRTYGYNLQSGGQLAPHFPTDEVRQKLSQKLMGHSLTKRQLETLRNNGLVNAKPVYCITTQEIFPSITEASRKYNIEINGISKCCNNKAYTTSLFDGTKLAWCFLSDWENKTYHNTSSVMLNPNYNPNQKSIYLFNQDFNIIQKFDSIQQLADFLNISRSKVKNYLNDVTPYLKVDNLKYIAIKEKDLINNNININDVNMIKQFKYNRIICKGVYKSKFTY